MALRCAVSYLDEDKSMTLRQWLGLDAVGDSRTIRWWRPPASQTFRRIPWRWLLALPAAASVGMLVAAHFASGQRGFLFYMGIKLLVLTLLLPVLAWDHYRQRAIRARPDPFCPHCGWTLTGLPQEGRCPECGEPYRAAVVEMYRRDPQWVRAYWEFDRRPPPVRAFNAAHPQSPLTSS